MGTAFLLLAGVGMTCVGYGLSSSPASDRFLVFIVLIALLLLVALQSVEPPPPWWDAVYLVLAGLIGMIAGRLLPAGSFSMAAPVAGAALLGLSLLTGGIFHAALGGLPAHWLWICSWTYLSGWIAIGLAPALRRLTAAWAFTGLIVFLALAAVLVAHNRIRGQSNRPRVAALNLYLITINIVLALAVLTRPPG